MWTYQQFLQYLKRAGRDLPLLPLTALPEAIDFGFMAKTTREMSQRTITDARACERMRRVRVHLTLASVIQPDEIRVQLDAHDAVGSYDQVQVAVIRSTTISDIAGVQATRHIGIIHTHPNDSPFSPQDCSHLLQPRGDGRVVVMLLGTTKTFMAMVMSHDTPTLEPPLIKRMVAIETTIVRHNTVGNAMERLLSWCQRFSIAIYSFPWRTLPWRKQTTVAHRISA